MKEMKVYLPTTAKEFARWFLGFFALLLAEKLAGVVSMFLEEPLKIDCSTELALLLFAVAFIVFAWMDRIQREGHLAEQRAVARNASQAPPRPEGSPYPRDWPPEANEGQPDRSSGR